MGGSESKPAGAPAPQKQPAQRPVRPVVPAAPAVDEEPTADETAAMIQRVAGDMGAGGGGGGLMLTDADCEEATGEEIAAGLKSVLSEEAKDDAPLAGKIGAVMKDVVALATQLAKMDGTIAALMEKEMAFAKAVMKDNRPVALAALKRKNDLNDLRVQIPPGIQKCRDTTKLLKGYDVTVSGKVSDARLRTLQLLLNKGTEEKDAVAASLDALQAATSAHAKERIAAGAGLGIAAEVQEKQALEQQAQQAEVERQEEERRAVAEAEAKQREKEQARLRQEEAAKQQAEARRQAKAKAKAEAKAPGAAGRATARAEVERALAAAEKVQIALTAAEAELKKLKATVQDIRWAMDESKQARDAKTTAGSRRIQKLEAELSEYIPREDQKEAEVQKLKTAMAAARKRAAEAFTALNAAGTPSSIAAKQDKARLEEEEEEKKKQHEAATARAAAAARQQEEQAAEAARAREHARLEGEQKHTIATQPVASGGGEAPGQPAVAAAAAQMEELASKKQDVEWALEDAQQDLSWAKEDGDAEAVAAAAAREDALKVELATLTPRLEQLRKKVEELAKTAEHTAEECPTETPAAPAEHAVPLSRRDVAEAVAAAEVAQSNLTSAEEAARQFKDKQQDMEWKLEDARQDAEWAKEDGNEEAIAAAGEKIKTLEGDIAKLAKVEPTLMKRVETLRSLRDDKKAAAAAAYASMLQARDASQTPAAEEEVEDAAQGKAPAAAQHVRAEDELDEDELAELDELEAAADAELAAEEEARRKEAEEEEARRKEAEEEARRREAAEEARKQQEKAVKAKAKAEAEAEARQKKDAVPETPEVVEARDCANAALAGAERAQKVLEAAEVAAEALRSQKQDIQWAIEDTHEDYKWAKEDNNEDAKKEASAKERQLKKDLKAVDAQVKKQDAIVQQKRDELATKKDAAMKAFAAVKEARSAALAAAAPPPGASAEPQEPEAARTCPPAAPPASAPLPAPATDDYDPNSIENMCSNAVLEWEVQRVTAEMAALKKAGKAVPDELTDRQMSANIKMQILVGKVQTGQLTVPMYIESLKARIQVEKGQALKYNREGNKDWAAQALKRYKLMEQEVKDTMAYAAGEG